MSWRWLLPGLVLFAAHAEARRFALVVGENRGLVGEETLRYALDDARRMREVLVGVGGVAAEDLVLVEGADAVALRETMTRFAARLAGTGADDRLVVYVSAHAGDGALHLDGTALPLEEVVEFVKRAPVGVAILVVDACRSGSMTRLKGLKALDEAPVKVEATGLKGRVLISASGADEYAQESDELKGSTFTHHFITGLRGAADASRDGKVTLDEVYAWAWARTIESTFGTRGGVQRPAFRVDLSGNGQLVLSEPAVAAGRLTLGVEAPGRWLVVSSQTGGIVADVDKPAGPMTLALAPGDYRVRLRVPGGVLERSIGVRAGSVASVTGDELERASVQRVALKGLSESVLTLSAGGGLTSGVVAGLVVHPGAELRLRLGVDLGPVNELTTTIGVRDGRSTGSGFRQTELELRAGLGHRFGISRLSVSLGVELGPMLIFQNELPALDPRTSLGGALQATVEGRLIIVRPLELYLLVLGGGALVKKSAGVVPVPRAALSGGIAFAF